MKKKISLLLVVFSLLLANTQFVYAQQVVPSISQYNASHDKKLTEEVVFQKGLDSSNDDYRRCPAVIVSNKGTVIVNCESRKSLSDGDLVGRIFARKAKNSSWTYNYLLPYDSVSQTKYMEGCFVVDRKGVISEEGKKNKGRIYFFYLMMIKTNANHGFAKDVTAEEVAQGQFASRYVYSDDDGITWSKEHNTSFDTSVWRLVFASPDNGIQMQNGTLVIPTWGIGLDGKMYAGLCYKKPRGEWTYSSKTSNAGDNESNVLEVAKGKVLLNCRKRDESKSIKEKRRTVYEYNFATDSLLYKGEYPYNSTCELGTCQYKVGKRDVFLMSFTNNDLSEKSIWARHNGTLFQSQDGLNWSPVMLMRDKDNEFGYSGVDTNGKTFGFTYELKGKQIIFVDFSALSSELAR